MRYLKLDPDDFKVVDACTIDYGDGTCGDYVFLEVAPGYYCDFYMDTDDRGVHATPCFCYDKKGYIYTADGLRFTTDAYASEDDMLDAEYFAIDYYIDHPEDFDAE